MGIMGVAKSTEQSVHSVHLENYEIDINDSNWFNLYLPVLKVPLLYR